MPDDRNCQCKNNGFLTNSDEEFRSNNNSICSLALICIVLIACCGGCGR